MQPLYQQEFSRIRVLDGALATELERRGHDLSGPLWSAQVIEQDPASIVAVHLDYLRAGADCITTASYQISAQGYAELGIENPAQAAERDLRLSVELAQEAVSQYARESSRPIWIAASLGPYGAVLHNGAEFHGNYQISQQQLVDFHRERLAVIAETEADLVAFETIPSVAEAQAILVAMADTPNLSAWISLNCKDEGHLAHGEPVLDAVRLLEPEVAVLAMGINCVHPRLIGPLLAKIREESEEPVIVYPNSGESWDATSRSWLGRADLGIEVEKFGVLAGQWFQSGAQAVGGCCRTQPDHIRAVAAAVRQ